MPMFGTRGAASARGFGLLSTIAAAVDEFFEYVTLLLPGNGTNGAQNNTFLDSSTNNFTITRVGNTTQGTFAPYGSLWSNYFNNSTGLALAYGTATHTFWNNDFTVEFWVNCGPKSFNAILSSWLDSDFNGGSWQFAIVNGVPGVSNRQSSGTNQASFITAGSTRVDDGLWHHVAITQVTGASKTFRMFVDGVLRGYKVENNWTQGSANSNIYIGTQGPGTFDEGSRYYLGYASNIRLVTSVVSAYSTSSTTLGTTIFTPPTSPLTAITNTNILTCQSNRFIDNSSNNFTITRSGDVSVQRFSPFNPTASYTPSTDGGSGYFDGTGDYLTAPDNIAFEFGSGNFTIEGWFYLTGGNSTFRTLVAKSSRDDPSGEGSFVVQISNANKLQMLFDNVTGGGWVIDVQGTTNVVLNTWYHFAVVRNGNVFTAYLNGVSEVTATNSLTLVDNAQVLTIGALGYTSGTFIAFVPGYISDVRLVKGTAVYTSAFTPPSAPLTAITNTSLLLNFTNAGIIDNAEMNNLETVGNAQISTAQSKFGGASMYFDGNGDYCLGPTSPSFEFGSGDFTIEAWLYRTADSGQYDSEIVGYGNPNTLNGWHFGLSGSSGGTANRIQLNLNYSGYLVISSGTIPVNTWTHVAVTRSGTSFKVFINGNQDGSATSSATPTTTSSSRLYVGTGAYDPGSVNRTITGYIDDLRITRGVARYVSSFSVPTAPFPTQ